MNAKTPRRQGRRAEIIALLCLFLGVLASWRSSIFAGEAAKPKVAVFPLGGNAAQDLRDRIGFSIRTKLDRGGIYDPIDGPAMQDLADAAQSPISFDSPSGSINNPGS